MKANSSLSPQGTKMKWVFYVFCLGILYKEGESTLGFFLVESSLTLKCAHKLEGLMLFPNLGGRIVSMILCIGPSLPS